MRRNKMDSTLAAHREDMLRKRIEESNQRINEALSVLLAHERGRKALMHLQRLCKGPAAGLDSAGLQALKALLYEFGAGRRDFLEAINHLIYPPDSNVAPVTERNADEYELHKWTIKASDLRIPAGHWPKTLVTTLGNQQPFVLQRTDEHGSAHYAQSLGCLSLVVLND